MADYLIIGNGVAGTTAAENIRKHDEDGTITIITDEDTPFYYRIRLTELISGDVSEEALIAKNEQWYEDLRIDLLLEMKVKKADIEKKTILTNDKLDLSFNKLLIATGSHSFIPPIKGSNKKGVFALRSIQDARDISVYADGIEDVVLIGGGLLGLEAGNALRKLGKKVTIVEFFPRLLPRQLDVEGAERLLKVMEDMGFFFRLGAKTQEIKGKAKVTSVLLEGGETLQTQMVIISAGVRPNMELAESLGLDRDKGIKVDNFMQTSQADVYAAGDVAEFRGIPYGIWPAAMEQGKIAGTNMAGGDMFYDGTTMTNTLKVVGIDLASAGNIDAENQLESRVVTDDTTYKKIVMADDQIIGCIMLGDTKGFNKITKAMADKKNVSNTKDKIFSEGFDFETLT
jgi:nitrite reductase (NADH) large subunit